jgi:hypothetical protein
VDLWTAAERRKCEAFRGIAAHNSTGSTTATELHINEMQPSTTHSFFERSETSQFYGEWVLGGLAFKVFGECHLAKTDVPERGLSSIFCTQNVSDLPADYVGGLVTTNTLLNSTHLVGTETEPPGYVQSSIATVRLWKKRVQ